MAADHTQLTHGGLCDSNHASSRLFDHDFELAQQTEQAAKYWNSVLKRLVSVIKFAC